MSLKLINLQKVELAACSHFRVVNYYAESIRNNCAFKGTPCDTYDNYKKNKCQCDSSLGCPIMGHDAHKNVHQGKFYLSTNKETPFCVA